MMLEDHSRIHLILKCMVKIKIVAILKSFKIDFY